ncbi:MAG: CueP family metal-binding protein [Bacteroidetes bacterium]|nr:CueP family metal-binding protein [Bacteroidota bacterium]
MIKQISLTILLVSIIIGCSNSSDPDYNSYYDSLTNLSAKESIAKGNDWKFSAPKIKTHVTSSEAIFEFPDGRVVKKTLPTDSFYVAIAPFINGTHTCETHYPSSCDGEMKEQTVKVIVTDESTNILFNGNINTLKNGFFELWLPRNKNIKIDIQYNSSIGTEIIPTKDDSRTCITTIKLE